MITHLGPIDVGWPLVEVADRIKLQHYKVNTPKQFHVEPWQGLATDVLMQQLSALAKVDFDKLDVVYFSCCAGAEEHVDELDPERFHSTTFVVPIILPHGRSTITAGGVTVEVAINNVYEFNHEQPHSMALEDTESGCVVLMVAVKK